MRMSQENQLIVDTSTKLLSALVFGLWLGQESLGLLCPHRFPSAGLWSEFFILFNCHLILLKIVSLTEWFPKLQVLYLNRKVGGIMASSLGDTEVPEGTWSL